MTVSKYMSLLAETQDSARENSLKETNTKLQRVTNSSLKT